MIVWKWSLNWNANASVWTNLTPTSISWVDWKSNWAWSFNWTTSRWTVWVNYYWNWSIHKTTVKFKVNTLPTSWNTQYLTCNLVDWWASWSILLYNSWWVQQIVSINYYTTWSIGLVVNYTLTVWKYYTITAVTDWTWMKLYLDWVLIWSNWNAWTFRTTANSFWIWVQPQWPSLFFNWVIDDVEIDNTVWWVALIKNNYLAYNWFI